MRTYPNFKDIWRNKHFHCSDVFKFFKGKCRHFTWMYEAISSCVFFENRQEEIAVIKTAHIQFSYSNKNQSHHWHLISSLLSQNYSSGFPWCCKIWCFWLWLFPGRGIVRKRECASSSAIWHVELCNPTHWPEWNICLHIQQLGFMGSCVSYVCSRFSDAMG